MYENIKDHTAPLPKKFNLICNETREAGDLSVIAFCTSLSHQKFLLLSDIARHRCFYKRCPYLRKLSDNPFWAKPHPEYKKQTEQIFSKIGQKQLQSFARDQNMKSAQLLSQLEKFTESWVKDHNLDDKFLVTSVRQLKDTWMNFGVYYISDNTCYDAIDYLQLVKDANKVLGVRVKLVHLKDATGHYLTIEEFKQLKRRIAERLVDHGSPHVAPLILSKFHIISKKPNPLFFKGFRAQKRKMSAKVDYSRKFSCLYSTVYVNI